MPFPGTRVIPSGWSTRHRPVAVAAMTATCLITRAAADTGTVDDATGITTPAAPIVIAVDVPCRVQALVTARRIDAAGQQATHRDYLVSLPSDTATVRVGDEVTFTSTIDSHLDGRVLRVIDVVTGSETWSLDLTCRDDFNQAT